jgi:uncharacterized protein (DUF952 family)
MTEQVKIKALKDFLSQPDLILTNIKYRQLHNKCIYFENYLREILREMIIFSHILFEKF